MLVSKTTVDWYKWGKIKTILLDDACGLLAGIDLPAHRWAKNHWEEQAQLYSDNLPDKHYMGLWRQELDDNVEELIKKQKIMEVVQNHINEGCFIPMKLKKISEKEFKKNHRFEEIPEGKKVGYWTVNLAEFGTWAKSAGFDLPPEFPIKKNTIATDSSNQSDNCQTASMDVNSLVKVLYNPEDTLQILNEYLNPFPKLTYSDLLDKILQEDLPLYVEIMFGTKTVRDARYSRLVGGIETAWLIYGMYYNNDDLDDNPSKDEILKADYDKACKVFGEPEIEGNKEPRLLEIPPFNWSLYFTRNDIIKAINAESPNTNSTTETIDSSLLPKFFDTSGLTNGRFFYESRLTNGRLDDKELRKCSANEYLDKLVLFCKTNEVSLDEGLRQLLNHLMGKRTDKTFLTLYETALSMLKDYEKINKAPEPVERPQIKSNTNKSEENEKEPTPILYKPETQKEWVRWIIKNEGLDASGNVKPRFRANFLAEGRKGFSNGQLTKIYDLVVKEFKS